MHEGLQRLRTRSDGKGEKPAPERFSCARCAEGINEGIDSRSCRVTGTHYCSAVLKEPSVQLSLHGRAPIYKTTSSG